MSMLSIIKSELTNREIPLKAVMFSFMGKSKIEIKFSNISLNLWHTASVLLTSLTQFWFDFQSEGLSVLIFVNKKMFDGITKTDLVMWQVWLRFLAFAMWAAVLLLIKSCGKNDSRRCGKHARDRQKVESNSSSKSHLSFRSGRNYTKQTICRYVVLISAQISACFTMWRSAVVPLLSLHN